VSAAPRGQDPVFRVAFDQTTSQDFGSLAGVDNVGGMPPLELRDYQKLLSVLDEYRRNILLNVEIVVTTGTYTDRSFELVAQQDEFKYYRFLVPKPRAYLVRDVVETTTSDEAAAQLIDPGFRYWDTAVVMGNTGLGRGNELAPNETAVIFGRSANTMVIRVATEEPRLLVVSDTYYPGWKAAIDGAPTQILQTNVALRGVVVPAGEHIITMTFRPTTLLVGLSMTGLTCLSLLVALGWWIATKRRLHSPIS
jgi:hypothetical protein